MLSTAITRTDESDSYGIRSILLERRDHIREVRALLIDVCLSEWHLSGAWRCATETGGGSAATALRRLR